MQDLYEDMLLKIKKQLKPSSDIDKLHISQQG